MKKKSSRKRIRRGKKGSNTSGELTVLYSNIQGVTGKKISLLEILESVDPDVCLLAETLTANFKLDGCKVILPHKSIGQNVAILLRRKLLHQPVVKIYEPNETINMI